MMNEPLDSYTNDYHKKYMKGYRRANKGDCMVENTSKIEFKSTKISLAKFKKHYKDKIDNKEQELIFNNCLDLIILIEDCKKAIEEEGNYYKNTTGVLKVNPLVKELRENIKSFTNLLGILHDLLEPVETETKVDNRFMKFAK